MTTSIKVNRNIAESGIWQLAEKEQALSLLIAETGLNISHHSFEFPEYRFRIAGQDGFAFEGADNERRN